VKKEKTTNLTLQLSVVLVKYQTSKINNVSKLFCGMQMKCELFVKALPEMIHEVFLFPISGYQKVLKLIFVLCFINGIGDVCLRNV
jgi:hypothetical protein